MIIEQPEAFRTWLTAILKPLCDADPEALAKYVLALIKKDKSEEELNKIMVGQLEVFLENETESFVKLVLQTLETQEYITTPVIPNTNPPNPIMLKSSKESKPVVHPSELPNLNEGVNGSTTARKEAHDAKRPKDTDEKGRVRSRNRSRSRSWERQKRSKSRERDHKRPRGAWRNKLPPRRFDRRRSRTPPSPKHRGGSGRYRNRTPPRSASRSRSRSRSPRKDKDLSRSATPTQDSNHGDMDMRLINSTQSIQSVVVQQQQGGGGNKRRCRDFDEKGYCMRGEMCPYDHGVDPVVLEDAALSSVLSYNPNSGPGEVVAPPLINAPPGHPLMGGPPRGGGGGMIAPEYNPQAPQMWNRPGFRGPRPPMPMPRGPMMGGFPNQPNMQRELIPVPVMDNKNEQFPNNNNTNNNNNQSGLISGGGGGKFRHHYHHGQQHHHHHHQNFFGPRSSTSSTTTTTLKNPANCSLELKKIPYGLNSITHLNNHFSKFGKPINIQVNYEGDPEAAIVTFSSHAEANAAYRSTEAVLNNRFIKVFWHNGNHSQPTTTPNDGKQENAPVRSIKDRLGIVVPPNTNKVLNLVRQSDNTASVTSDTNQIEQQIGENNENNSIIKNKEETKAQQAAAIKKNQELLAAKEKLKKNQDEQRKNVLKIKDNLRKRKQELLGKQLSQQKILIEKLEKTPAGPARDIIRDTIKKTQESIEAIQKDLSQIIQQQQQQPIVQKNSPIKQQQQLKAKEDVQRELLDAELDLITKQAEGADTSEIQMKLNELKAKASGLNRTSSGIRGGLRSGLIMSSRRFNPIKRHLLSKNNLVDNTGKGNVKSVNKVATFQKHTVDHRPTRLLVSGYETDEQESVLNHFQTFGEIADYETDATLPSITLNYKTRKEAEMALLKGKHFQDRTLSITWCNSVNNNQMQQRPPSTRQVLLSETDEDQLIDTSLADGDEDLGPEISEEALLQDDEEEDEENEDRSWRR